MIMLKDETKFDRLGQKLFMKGVLQDFEKKNGPIKGRMMVTEGKIPPEILTKLQSELMNSSNWIVVEGSFDFYNYTVGMIVDLTTGKPLANGWLVPQFAISKWMVGTTIGSPRDATCREMARIFD